jgi:hypothetical protein
MSSVIYLNTRDRDDGQNDNAIFYANKSQLSGYKKLTLESFSMQHSMYPFSPTRCNNIIYVQIAGITSTTYEAVIPANNYTSSQFTTELATQLNSAASGIWTVTYDSQSGKLTITKNGTFRFVDGPCSGHAEVGYDLTDTVFELSKVMHSPLNLSGTQYIDVVTNIAGSSWNSTGTYTVLVRVPLSESFGDVIIYNANLKHSLMTRGSMTQLEFALRDDRGRRLGLDENSHVNYTFLLEEVHE